MDAGRRRSIFITYISMTLLYVSTTEVFFSNDYAASFARRCKFILS